MDRSVLFGLCNKHTPVYNGFLVRGDWEILHEQQTTTSFHPCFYMLNGVFGWVCVVIPLAYCIDEARCRKSLGSYWFAFESNHRRTNKLPHTKPLSFLHYICYVPFRLVSKPKNTPLHYVKISLSHRIASHQTMQSSMLLLLCLSPAHFVETIHSDWYCALNRTPSRQNSNKCNVVSVMFVSVSSSTTTQPVDMCFI